MRIAIRTAKNGFIVYPESATERHREIDDTDVSVFETYEGLTKYLKEYFGPLVETNKPIPIPNLQPIRVRPCELSSKKKNG